MATEKRIRRNVFQNERNYGINVNYKWLIEVACDVQKGRYIILKKRIVIAGLLDKRLNNFGEYFLKKTVEYIKDLVNDDYDTCYLEMQYRGGYYYLGALMRRILKYIPLDKDLYHRLLYIIVRYSLKSYYCKCLKNADGLIIAAGSFKYSTQSLWMYYSLLCECCKELEVPVMFDAMNIQRFSATDQRCKILRNHANYDCVKMISSRDGDSGVKRLRESYIDNPKIELLPVGDPALWIPECYGVLAGKPRKLIGINLIRSTIFLDYGGNVTEDRLISAYADLIKILNSKDIAWEFFTNGMKSDEKIVIEICRKAGIDRKKHKIHIPKNDKELVEMIASYKGIVGARLHACICAYALDVPMCGFVWDEKVSGVANLAKMKKYFCTEDDLSGKKLYEKLCMSIENGYDRENREFWKQKTKASIEYFLNKWC